METMNKIRNSELQLSTTAFTMCIFNITFLLPFPHKPTSAVDFLRDVSIRNAEEVGQVQK